MKVFYSWQSDFEPSKNRYFIRDALKIAIDRIGETLALDEASRPELDHDTKGELGAVDISKVILEKIESAAAFVADVTPITSINGKSIPNPNVMFELGWALHALGPRAVVLVINRASGATVEQLPFDLRQRRCMQYTLPPNAENAVCRKVEAQFAGDIEGILVEMLKAASAKREQAAPIVGIDANGSIWATAQNQIGYQPNGGARSRITLVHGPRSFVRVVPKNWPNSPLPVFEYQALPREKKVLPMFDRGRAGSGGYCQEGYVEFSYNEVVEDDVDATSDVVMYFDLTGEIWSIFGEALVADNGKTYSYPYVIAKHWRSKIRAANRFFNHIGASSTRQIEIGVVGLAGSEWPQGGFRLGPVCRRDDVQFKATKYDWDEVAQDEFILASFNRLIDLFGMPAFDQAKFEKALSRV